MLICSRPHVNLANTLSINGLKNERPHVRPHVRPHLTPHVRPHVRPHVWQMIKSIFTL